MRYLIILLFSCSLGTLMAQKYEQLELDPNYTFDEIVRDSEAHFDTIGRGKHTGYKQFKRWEYWSRRSLDVNGRVISKARAHKNLEKFQAQEPKTRMMSNTWEEMGPGSAVNTTTWSSHIGRLTSMGIDVNDVNHYIVGGQTGGVWRTTDDAANWTPVFDNQADLSVWSLEISHANSDHYFCGTSELGIMKSTDAGTTWTQTNGPDTDGRYIRIAMHPTNANILLAINQWYQIYRSIDGGDNWILEHSPQVQLYDIEFKPGDPSVIYASGDGKVYRSTDTGDFFSELSGPWSADGAMMMGVTPADQDYLYIVQDDNGFQGLYLSEDGGNSFSVQSDDSAGNNNILGYDMNGPGSNGARDLDVVASPTDKTEVHVAGIMTFKSTNSGQTWDQTTHWVINNPLAFVHADVDFLFYQGNRLYCGSDGGLFVSTDKAVTFQDKTTGLGVRQFYRIGVSETEEDRVSGGSQDNGTGTVINGNWVDWVGADGMETFIAKHDEDIMYGSVQFGGLYKTIDGGQSSASVSNPPGGSGDWVTPLEQDPIVNNRLFQAKDQVYRSDDGGQNWSAISNFPNGGTIKELAIAPTNNNVIVAAYRTQVYLTTNGGNDWSDVTPSIGFNGINYIHFHPEDDNKILLTLSGSFAKVVESVNQGNTWLDITGNLPGIGAECAIYSGHDGGMYIGMSPGIFHRDDNDPNWSSYVTGLPNVRTGELELKHDFLYAGTYGRGLWKVQAIHVSNCSIESWVDNGLVNCANGRYDRSITVSYVEPPTGGTLIVNNQSFPITGSPQTLTINDLPVNGEMHILKILFSDDQACSLTSNFDNPANCPCTEMTFYADADGDGFGDSNNTVLDCSAPSGYVANDTDCDDTDPNNYPGNTEVCDGSDNNCDGIVDEGCSNTDCDDIFLVINTANQQPINRAQINLKSTATVSSSQTILYTAGTDIDLEPNFEVAMGAVFEARIESCTTTNPVIPGHVSYSNFNSLDELAGFVADNNWEVKTYKLTDMEGMLLLAAPDISSIQTWINQQKEGDFQLQIPINGQLIIQQIKVKTEK